MRPARGAGNDIRRGCGRTVARTGAGRRAKGVPRCGTRGRGNTALGPAQDNVPGAMLHARVGMVFGSRKISRKAK